MIRLFIVGLAFLASSTYAAPIPRVLHHDDVVATVMHDAWLDERATAFVLAPFDLVIPATPDLVPPTPIVGDDDPHAAACVAGERPLAVRRFQRGTRGYTATC